MDSTSLDHAHQALLEAAEAATSAGTTAPPGQWDIDQQLAHVIAVDAGILAVACTVAAGADATFDNRLSQDTHTLARIGERAGGRAGMLERIRGHGRAMCQVVDQLSEEELQQPVRTLLVSVDMVSGDMVSGTLVSGDMVSGGTVLVDQPLSLRDLLTGIAEDHLPGHAHQLLELVPGNASARS